MCIRKNKTCADKKKLNIPKIKKKTVQFFDEFTKIVFVILLIVGVGTIVASFVAIFTGKTVPAAVIPTALGLLFGDFLGYCFKSFAQKDSLNKNGLTILKDGTITKIADKVSKIVSSISTVETTSDVKSDSGEDSNEEAEEE